MPNEASFLDITLLGKEYRVAEKTRSNLSERIAVMAALNIAHEHLHRNQESPEQHQKIESEIGLDIDDVRRRISFMEAELEAVLKPQQTGE